MLARRRDGRPQIVLLDHGLYKRISDDFRCASNLAAARCLACFAQTAMSNSLFCRIALDTVRKPR